MKKLLAKAIMIASTAFVTTFDKGGKPYILHCLWVMNQVRHLGMDYMIVAVLHDLVEDTDWTIEQLRNEGFPDYILISIDIITHKEDSYEQYIQMISLKLIMEKLIKALHTFDNYYEMTEDSRVYDRGYKQEKEIKSKLTKLSKEEIVELKSKLNEGGLFTMNRYFSKF